LEATVDCDNNIMPSKTVTNHAVPPDLTEPSREETGVAGRREPPIFEWLHLKKAGIGIGSEFRK